MKEIINLDKIWLSCEIGMVTGRLRNVQNILNQQGLGEIDRLRFNLEKEYCLKQIKEYKKLLEKYSTKTDEVKE